MLTDHNVPQLSENANGTHGNGWERRSRTDCVFSISEYSAEEQRDYVDILKPFTGTVLDKKRPSDVKKQHKTSLLSTAYA